MAGYVKVWKGVVRVWVWVGMGMGEFGTLLMSKTTIVWWRNKRIL